MKLEPLGKGYYKIINRVGNKKTLTCGGTACNHQLVISELTRGHNQVWRIENTYNNLFKVSNKQYSALILLVSSDITSGKKAGLPFRNSLALRMECRRGL
jgi:hypothetical protein